MSRAVFAIEDRRETFAVELPEGTDLPQWVNIVPPPDAMGFVRARDGRVLYVPDPEALVAASNEALRRQAAPGKDVGPGPVDADHRLYDAWAPGGAALGWATGFEVREDRSIWASVEWLEEGAALLRSKTYRYTSGVFASVAVEARYDEWGVMVSPPALKPTLIEGFGLTNIPALEVRALFTDRNADMKTKILARFGLEPTATLEQLDAAIEAKFAAVPSLDQYVPRETFDRLSAELAQAKAALAKIEEEAAEQERAALISDALKTGKITPAQQAFFLETMRQPGGVDRFRTFLSSAPALINTPTPALAPTHTAPVRRSKAAASVGLSPADFAAARAARSAQLRALRDSNDVE